MTRCTGSLQLAAPWLWLACWLLAPALSAAPQNSSQLYGLGSAPRAAAYLSMPVRSNAPFPALLSQTGAFRDAARLLPAAGLIPYDIIVPFWSDGAVKTRWMACLPTISPAAGKSLSRPAASGLFPSAVFVKNFELADDETRPEHRRRLETVCSCSTPMAASMAPFTNGGLTTATPIFSRTNLSESIEIKTASGTRTQTWYYPSRQDCLVCHTARAGLVLGVKTRQLNREFTYPSGQAENELVAWSKLGFFDSTLEPSAIAAYPALARGDDARRTLEERARSYLDANCAHCHRPGGTVAYFDARYDTPLAKQNLLGGQILLDEGVDGARAIAPNDLWRSIIYLRANSTDAIKMPALAHNEIDQQGMALLRQWIESLPGSPVLPPPEISPPQGQYDHPVNVALKETEDGAEIRYTLDGSLPTKTDSLYEKPFTLSGPTILRAKAFKNGFTKSITTQAVFAIGN